MCGVSGIMYFNRNFFVKKKQIHNMNLTLKHRGPDASGIWISKMKNIGLGHTRLSIIDLSKEANQPFVDPTKNYILAFNGEIYNYEEIKKKLINKGYKFKTNNSDTEILLLSYIEWGEKCLNYFRGMFAFALWDEKLQRLWLVRDRLGVKPMYYKIDNNKIIFASEIKAILLDKTYKKEIDERCLFDYLTYCCAPPPKTMFKGIYKIEAGQFLIVEKSGKIKKKKYWDPLQNPVVFNDKKNNFFESIRNELEKSIKLRLVADVKTGIFLSGGIDSSTNAYISAKNSKKIHTFSIGYDKEYSSYKSELKYAKKVAEDVNSNHFEKKLSKEDFTNVLEKIIYHQDEPISDPVCIPIYYLSQLATNKNVKVCQVGEGADELFFGYTNWLRTLKIKKILDNYFFKKICIPFLIILFKVFKIEYKYSYDLLLRAKKNLPIFWSGAEAFTDTEKKKILSEKLKKRYINEDSWKVVKNYYKSFMRKAQNKSFINWMTYVDLKLRLPELLLMRIDKMTMASSLEGRVPFLDYKLVEKMIDLPSNVKLKDNNLKCILKICVNDLLPSFLLKRKKQGFGLPLKDWLKEGLGVSEKKLIISFANETQLLNSKEIENILEKRPDDTRIWFLFNLALWWKVFFKHKSPLYI